jgi:transcription elongation factor Elf1
MPESDLVPNAHREITHTLICPLCKNDVANATLSELEVGIKIECSKCGLSIQLDR